MDAFSLLKTINIFIIIFVYYAHLNIFTWNLLFTIIIIIIIIIHSFIHSFIYLFIDLYIISGSSRNSKLSLIFGLHEKMIQIVS